jgi:UDP-2,3-diacylglucosamine pyrophosphatase LpxH
MDEGRCSGSSFPLQRDLLVFSDVHLGSDLKRQDLRRAGSFSALVARDAMDKALGGFLDDYAGRSLPGQPWRLILNGDLVDFIGINLTPRDVAMKEEFTLSPEEEMYGLEPGPERCVFLMRLVLLRHPYFFQRLAAFLAAGHELIVIRGNHDAAFFWPEVQAVFTAGLVEAARAAGVDEAGVVRVTESVRFEDWFYLEPGRIYIEHGHAHDEYCADPGVRPVESDRPDRLSQPVSTLTLRYFANRFPTLDLDDVDQWTAWQFIRWACVIENPVRVGWAFLQATVLLLLPTLRRSLRRMRRARAQTGPPVGEEDVTNEKEIAARVRARLAQGVHEAERLAFGVARLVRRSAQVDVMGVMRMLYLDRAATLGVGVMLSASCMAVSAPWTVRLALAGILLAMALVADHHLKATRKVAVGPKLRSAADELSPLMGVPLVVMGHSHKAVDTILADGTTRYVNLGSWLSATRPDVASRLGLPHLVVRGGSAELLRWRPRA